MNARVCRSISFNPNLPLPVLKALNKSVIISAKEYLKKDLRIFPASLFSALT